ncbi:MAG: hypothetical protein K6F57_00345 [Candidatus Saccharibacteria bacterium]|nr:hypothetical protein [Candidatus Saccharibacteria bacterium]
MSTKKVKTNNRVKFNTLLLVLVAIVFAVISFFSMINLAGSSTWMMPISNGRGLCFDETVDSDGAKGTKNEGVCASLGGDEERTKDINDVAMFLYNKIYYAEQTDAYRSAFSTFVIGLMFTIASLTGAVVYWNHNKNK